MPWSAFEITTSALGTSAPDGSFTVPEIEPLSCAQPPTHNATTSNTICKNMRSIFMVKALPVRGRRGQRCDKLCQPWKRHSGEVFKTTFTNGGLRPQM